ncbi:MAG TPA: hypothetical protein VNP04_21815 [Alphaproteobacteria bacterium]|nr:hypothetical protein [Alphaproteobacteria bacterium]
MFLRTKGLEEIYERHIKPLPAADRLRLVEIIAHGLLATIGRDLPLSHSLLELEGLGAGLWQSIDAQVYVDELRRE